MGSVVSCKKCVYDIRHRHILGHFFLRILNSDMSWFILVFIQNFFPKSWSTPLLALFKKKIFKQWLRENIDQGARSKRK